MLYEVITSAEGGTYGLHDEAVLAGGSPLRVEDNLAFYDVCVITSYSIHYTKLYEGLRRGLP